MKYFFYQQDLGSTEISEFPHILEFACKKLDKAVPSSLRPHRNKGIEFCYIEKGQYNWQIEDDKYSLFPRNASITCPWQIHGNPKGILELGVLRWLILSPKSFSKDGQLELGNWSKLSKKDQNKIGHILSTNKVPVFNFSQGVLQIFSDLIRELHLRREFSRHRVNALIDSLLIYISRKIKDESEGQDTFPFSHSFKELHQQLSLRLNHSWTLEEIAALVHLGKTTLCNKMKAHTGFSPLSYLNQIRVKEAQNLLSGTQKSITDIALSCGFYSSQHFATSFKKVTGKTPREYRKSDFDINSVDIPVW